MANVSEGQTAPDFDLPWTGGGTLKLSALRGGTVVLFFYPKDDTTGCTLEAADFSRLKPDFEAAGATVIGLSPDPMKKHDRFRKKHDLSVELVSDPTTEILSGYGLWVEKSMYGRKYMGVERTTLLIDASGTIVRIWPKVSVPGHAEEVLEAVKALG